ncbi:MAG TPA: hypothetical protein VGN07_23770 [Steroidobacteraceae bacterium]|jgi:hypothetical protein
MTGLCNDSVEIATAALVAAQTPSVHVQTFLDLMAAKKPSSEVVARSLVYSSAHYQGAYHQHIYAMLNAYLQLVLTREHVAAQEKMSKSAGYLAVVSVLVAILGLFGGFLR